MQRSIEILIGKLITDEDFRRSFMRDPNGTLARVAGSGLALTPCETRALMAIDPTLWDRVANQIDSRLQKASLTND